MAKPFNQKLNEDIIQLKKLHVLKDKTEFNKMKSEVMKRHNISKATVYREMQKDVPGSYDRKRHERPVTAKEIQMVRELLEQQYKVQEVIPVMERKTGMPYSWDRIDKIRSIMSNDKFQMTNEKTDTESISSAQLPMNNEKQEAGALSSKIPLTKGEAEVPPRLEDENKIKNETLRQAQGEESGFGDNLRAFIDELMDADRLAEGKFITVTLGGVPYRLNRQLVKDITMMITNYAECYLASVQLKRPEPEDDEYLLFNHWFIKEGEPLSPIDELVKKQEAVLRKQFGPGGFNDLERDPVKKKEEGPCDISELNRIRIFHLVAEKIRSAVSGSFITLKELKELNEINRYFKEYGEY